MLTTRPCSLSTTGIRATMGGLATRERSSMWIRTTTGMIVAMAGTMETRKATGMILVMTGTLMVATITTGTTEGLSDRVPITR